MTVPFSHVQYIKGKKEVLADTSFTEDFITRNDVTEKLLWLADVNPGFNATVDTIDLALKSAITMQSQTGNLSTIPKFATVAADDGGALEAWQNPTNANGDANDTYTYAYTTPGARATNYLKCDDFDFAIPTDAVITDITCSIKGYAQQSGNGYLSGRLLKAGTFAGDTKGTLKLETFVDITSSTGYCGTAANGEIGNDNWIDPTNAQSAENSTYAVHYGSESDMLDCTNFGFAITAGDVVTSRSVSLYVKGIAGGNIISFYEFDGTTRTLFSTHTVPIGLGDTAYIITKTMPDKYRTWTDTEANASTWGVSIMVTGFPGAGTAGINAVKMTVNHAPTENCPTGSFGSGLWGTTWDPADINHVDFGIGIKGSNSTGENTYNIDAVYLTIRYTLAGSDEYTVTVKINPQELGWETVWSQTYEYVIGTTSPTTKTEQEQIILAAAELTNAKAPFQIGMFLTCAGSIDTKNASLNGSFVALYGDSQ